MRWRIALLVMAILAVLAPLPGAIVERVYSRGVFPRLQPVLTTLSNLVPFPIFDVLIITTLVVSGWWLVRAIRVARRRGWLVTVGRAVLAAATVAAAAYLAFLLAWGLNYRRLPLSASLDFDPSRVSGEAALRLGKEAVARLNDLHPRAHAAGWAGGAAVDPVLVESFRRAVQDLGGPVSVVPGRPKRTILDPYFIRAGVAGMTDPYFLETMVASDLLVFERPAVVAHEWAHLAGFADESEANFVGWLACLRGRPPHQYSGWLALYGDLAASLTREEWRDLNTGLGEGPRADIRAVRERYERNVNPQISAAGWKVYDEYLKANRVESGARSYAEVVTLVLGTRFGPDWKPALRAK